MISWGMPHYAVLRIYSWFCTQDSVLVDSRDHRGCGDQSQVFRSTACKANALLACCAFSLWPLIFFCLKQCFAFPFWTDVTYSNLVDCTIFRNKNEIFAFLSLAPSDWETLSIFIYQRGIFCINSEGNIFIL